MSCAWQIVGAARKIALDGAELVAGDRVLDAQAALEASDPQPRPFRTGYLLRDRDTSYGSAFRDRVKAMGIEEVLTAPRSPWQNPFVERLIGSIRRECLDHIIINERHLRHVLSCYFQYHQRARTHLSLDKDCPQPRPIQSPSAGKIIAFPEVGGLHHRYERRAA